MSTVTRHLQAVVPPDNRLLVVLSWDQHDPFAVTMDVYVRLGLAPERWVFALDLLEAGLHGLAGELDIFVLPASESQTRIVLRPPGRVLATLLLPSAGIAAFLADTFIVDAPPIPDLVADIDWGEVSEL